MRSVSRFAGLCVLIALNVTGELRGQDTLAPSAAATSTLIGSVTDSAGTPLAGAEIALLGSTTLRTTTTDSGTFRLGGLPIGSVVLSVRRLGFSPATFTAVLKAGRVQRARLTLSAAAQALPTVAVSDTALKTHWLDQFEARRTSQRGTFLNRKDIEKKTARNGTDLLRTIPGIGVTYGRLGGADLQMTRGAAGVKCTPQIFVHSVPYSGTMDDFLAEDIEALEIYVGVSEVPSELARSIPSNIATRRGMMATPCAAIVVWTRDPRKKP